MRLQNKQEQNMPQKDKLSAQAKYSHPIRQWRMGKQLIIEDAIKKSKTNVTYQCWRLWESGTSPSDLSLYLIAKMMGIKTEELGKQIEQWHMQYAPKTDIAHAG
jgi:hypothetical protein